MIMMFSSSPQPIDLGIYQRAGEVFGGFVRGLGFLIRISNVLQKGTITMPSSVETVM